MYKKNIVVSLVLVFSMLFGLSTPAAVFAASNSPAVDPPPPPPFEDTEYFQTEKAGTIDGEEFIRSVIGSPPQPPDGYLRTSATDLPEPHLEAGINTLSEVPAFTWVHGCSATSAAMIASYYDRTFFANMYTGPTNEGVVPMNNSAWGTWVDSYGDIRAQMPLAASRQGLDGRATRGGVDDYWRGYGNSTDDPFIGNWAEHSYGDSIGDYMRTNQSNFDNPDGSTSFYTWVSNPGPFTCSQMEGYGILDDGTVGVKNFYEARGYTVTECYNQRTDVAGGFTFEDYKAEIDAGYPVMFHVHGHTMIGVGYNDSNQTMYIHDTWDYSTHTMTWNGSYSNMDMYSVSIVHLEPQILEEGIHNDDDMEITYSAGWSTALNASFYSGDNHYSTSTGNYANFKFAGGTFKIRYTGASNRGSMNVYVDNTLVDTINQYSSSTDYQTVWTSTEFPAGEHAVRLEHASGSVVDIDAIEIVAPCLDSHTKPHRQRQQIRLPAQPNPRNAKIPVNTTRREVIKLDADPCDPDSIISSWTGTGDDSSMGIYQYPHACHPATTRFRSIYYIPPGPGTYQNTDSLIDFTGNWTTWSDARASGGSTLYSNDETAEATFWFTGRQVSLLFTRYTTRGNIAITIDDGTPVTLNQYGSGLSFQNRWDSPIMDEGIHVVHFYHPGGSHYIDFDALIVSSPETTPPAAVILSAETGSTLAR